jgi:uncharacterized protein YpuA (DUF1002 family)
MNMGKKDKNVDVTTVDVTINEFRNHIDRITEILKTETKPNVDLSKVNNDYEEFKKGLDTLNAQQKTDSSIDKSSIKPKHFATLDGPKIWGVPTMKLPPIDQILNKDEWVAMIDTMHNNGNISEEEYKKILEKLEAQKQTDSGIDKTSTEPEVLEEEKSDVLTSEEFGNYINNLKDIFTTDNEEKGKSK